MINTKFEAIAEEACREFWDAIKPHPVEVGGRVFVLYKPVQPELDKMYEKMRHIPKIYMLERLEEILYEGNDSSENKE